MRGVDLDDLEAGRERARRRRRETPARPPGCRRAVSALGARSPSLNGTALGATVVHPPDSSASCCPPSQGRATLAFRPACASWMPATAPSALMTRTTAESPRMCSSFQMPRSWGEIRPPGVTAVASVKTSPAPPTARVPRCTTCQSLAAPSMLEYWHIGLTTTRFRSVRLRRVSGSKQRWRGGVGHALT